MFKKPLFVAVDIDKNPGNDGYHPGNGFGNNRVKNHPVDLQQHRKRGDIQGDDGGNNEISVRQHNIYFENNGMASSLTLFKLYIISQQAGNTPGSYKFQCKFYYSNSTNTQEVINHAT